MKVELPAQGWILNSSRGQSPFGAPNSSVISVPSQFPLSGSTRITATAPMPVRYFEPSATLFVRPCVTVFVGQLFLAPASSASAAGGASAPCGGEGNSGFSSGVGLGASDWVAG